MVDDERIDWAGLLLKFEPELILHRLEKCRATCLSLRSIVRIAIELDDQVEWAAQASTVEHRPVHLAHSGYVNRKLIHRHLPKTPASETRLARLEPLRQPTEGGKATRDRPHRR